MKLRTAQLGVFAHDLLQKANLLELPDSICSQWSEQKPNMTNQLLKATNY